MQRFVKVKIYLTKISEISEMGTKVNNGVQRIGDTVGAANVITLDRAKTDNKNRIITLTVITLCGFQCI